MYDKGHVKAAWFRSTTCQAVHTAMMTSEETLGDILLTHNGLQYKYVKLTLANSESETLPYGYVLSNPQTIHVTESGGCTVDIELADGSNGKDRIYPPAAGWTNAMSDTYESMFLYITDSADTTLIGQGGYILGCPTAAAGSTSGWITLDRYITIAADVNDLDFAIFDMPLHVVEPCGASSRTSEPVVVGTSEVRYGLDADDTQVNAVPDNGYFWMRCGPRGSLFHVWTGDATAEESCLKCASEGKAGATEEGDELYIGNITFAEAVTANAQQAAQLIMAKWTIGF